MLIEKIELIKHNLDDLKESITSDSIGEFSCHIAAVNKMSECIDDTKDIISKAKKKDLPEKKGTKIPKRLQQVFEKSEIKICRDGCCMNFFEVSYRNLHQLQQRICFLFLSIFPENAIITRRPLIYWWIGMGLITSEEQREKMFESLLKLDLIIPSENGKSPHLNKFQIQIHPWIRCMLIFLAVEASILEFHEGGEPIFQAYIGDTLFISEDIFWYNFGSPYHFSAFLSI